MSTIGGLNPRDLYKHRVRFTAVVCSVNSRIACRRIPCARRADTGPLSGKGEITEGLCSPSQSQGVVWN
jgi:hypothetical protein